MAARSKILDIARNQIISLQNTNTNKTNKMVIFNPRHKAEVEASKAALATAQSERAAAVRELSKLTGESTSAINARKTAAKPVYSGVTHRAAAPVATNEASAKAFAVALLDEQARRAAIKPLTGLAKVTAAFQKEAAEKAAKAKPAARNPEISNLTGIAKVQASFAAQSKKSN